MGRKADPRGKDRPRTIVLAGDVAEIAQRLAETSKLSSTLSELLRTNYGFGDKIAEKKRELSALLDEKQRIDNAADELEQEIDRLEQESIENDAHVRPQIEKRIAILTERMTKINHELQHGYLPPNEKMRKLDVFDEVKRLLGEARAELEALQ